MPRARELAAWSAAAMALLCPLHARAQDAPAPTAAAAKPVSDKAAPKARAERKVRQYTLAETLKLAERHADSLKVADAKRDFAGWQEYRARRGWAPQISATTLLAPVPANTDPNNATNNFDEIFALNIGPFIRQTVRIVQPVYTFGRIASARALAKVGVQAAVLEREKALLELHVQVRKAYLGAALARRFAEMLDDGERLVKKKVEEMEEAREFGDAKFKIKDLRKLQIFEAELASRQLDNKKLITLALAGLEYLTGRAWTIEEIPPLDESGDLDTLDTLEAYMMVAQDQRVELRQLARLEDARNIQVDLRRAEFFPNLFVAGEFAFGRSNQSIARQKICREVGEACEPTNLTAAPFSNPYRQLTFGITLGLRWDFETFQTYGKYKESQAQLATVRAQRAQARGAISLEIKKLHLEAAQARERVSILERRMTAARRWRDQVGLSVQSAGADLSDALEPLQAYYQARVLYLQARLDYNLARAALAQGIGLRDLKNAQPLKTQARPTPPATPATPAASSD